MRKLFFVVLIFVARDIFAQGQNNIWYFGHYAGIDFNSGSAISISTPLESWEGVSTICDSNGVFLFSSNGEVVFNALGDTIVSGLAGSQFATQSALIVPFPSSASKYYIFTSPEGGAPPGICYSIIDMNLNSGLGDSVSLNTQLLPGASEKICGVRNTNGTDFWVIVYSDSLEHFYSFPVTSSGVGNPVISMIGDTLIDDGYLKSSPDGKKLAYVYSANFGYGGLFDFNAATGVISNYIYIPSLFNPYGVSFSPDNSKLYISLYTYPTTKIIQFDLTIPNFQNNPYLVVQSTADLYSALALGPDGKIYCSNHTGIFVSAINNPNGSGAACNFINYALQLQNNTEGFAGMQNFIENFFNDSCSVDLNTKILSCLNNYTDTLDSYNNFENYLWNTGETTSKIQVADSGYYSVTVTNTVGCTASDTVYVEVLTDPNILINSISDTLSCINSQNGSIDINATGGTGSYTYLWSNGATTQDLNNLTAGTYTVTVTDSVGCIVSNSPITIVQINDMQVSNTAFNNLKCYDDTNGFINVTVSNGLSPNNYEWSNGATTEDLYNLTAGTYSVTVSDAGGCTASDTVVITAPNQVIASLTTAADTVFCGVTGGTPSYHYHWSTGATTAFITSATNGTYTVTVSDINNCTAIASVVISDVQLINEEGDFVIYPNPVSEELIVKSEKLFDASIEMIDVLGRTVSLLFTDNNKQITIDTRTFSEGVYFIKLVSSSGLTVVKKFVVVH